MQMHERSEVELGLNQNPSKNLTMKKEVCLQQNFDGDLKWMDADLEASKVVDEEEDMFYENDDAFPSLPDFPCFSSPSSSTSPTPPPPLPTTASSSNSSSSSSSSGSASSWAMAKTEAKNDCDQEQAIHQTPPSLEPDSMDQLTDLDLLNIWESVDLFYEEGNQEEQRYHQEQMKIDETNRSSEDLALIFFEWLKNNKESISSEDLRRIKLKRSTIECAAHRLGGGKEGMIQLLKLILAWVQNHHLQKRKGMEDRVAYLNQSNPSDTCFSLSNPWISNPQYVQTPWISTPISSMNNPQFLSMDYSMGDSSANWLQHYTPFVETRPLFSTFSSNPYGFQSHGERMIKQASATKEARKKRMARQRRLFNRNHHHSQNQSGTAEPSRLMAESGATSAAKNNLGGWMLLSSPPSSSSSSSSPCLSPSFIASDGVHSHGDLTSMPQTRQQQRQFTSERGRQGWKPEKNLKFLLQKVLKQSDVGNLGRIVLPKKEAETYLPELEARDGISIEMQDIVTSRVWNMRYRFWPNNKSRMYLLENTGDFVRANGLQEGDFIVIYSDIKCGKYMIRGVKVPQDSRQETRNPGKNHSRPVHGASCNGDGSSSILESVTE